MNLSNLQRCIIRTDGTVEPFTDDMDFDTIERNIDAGTLDAVTLVNAPHPGIEYWIMWVDDVGLLRHKEPNPVATGLYAAICRPEARHECLIVGDVVIHNYTDSFEEDQA